MKGEDLYDGITGIRDDQINEAESVLPEKKGRPLRGQRILGGASRRFRRTAAIAAVLTLTLIAGFFWQSWKGSPGSYVIAAADYPKQEKYSERNWDAWRDERSEKRNLYDVYDGCLDNFMIKAVPEILSGAGEENRVCSPLSLYMALSMLAEITDGASREQILTLLDCEDIETVRSRADALWNANYVDDGTVTSLLANSLWMNKKVDFVQKTMDTLAETYHASSYRGEMGTEEYNEALRKWIDQNTGGKLKEQAKGLSMDQWTLLALVSTVYYRAKWSGEFQKENTFPETFHAPDGDRTTDFMHQTFQGAYYWGDKFSAVAMGLKNSGSMWFILPDEGVSADELLQEGTVTEFLNARGNWESSRYMEVHFSVPKFDVTGDLDLISCLEALGITDIFDPQAADFSPMLSSDYPAEEFPPFVSQVKHAARVMVDEKGCEAASYTIVAVNGQGAPPADMSEIDFVLDRPFLFAITGADGMLLFVGTVNQP